MTWAFTHSFNHEFIYLFIYLVVNLKSYTENIIEHCCVRIASKFSILKKPSIHYLIQFMRLRHQDGDYVSNGLKNSHEVVVKQ